MKRFLHNLRTALRNPSANRRAARPAGSKNPFSRLKLEALEERCVPAAFVFSTGAPDGRMATASQPASAGKPEIESADDFILSSETKITHATFTGLLPAGTKLSVVADVRVEIYRVFGKDSNLNRTPHVPTRVNSPSDVEFEDRDSSSHDLTFGFQLLNPKFRAANTVVDGIHTSPNQRTGGEGAASGEEVRFDVSFTTPFDLPADHYFFVPQVQLKGGGHFLWLSAASKQFAGDLQEWIRDDKLDPDWLRVGTDIVGGSPAPTFNASFSLDGHVVTPWRLPLLSVSAAPSAVAEQAVQALLNQANSTPPASSGLNPDDVASVLSALLGAHR
jgi:hypothetical protein